MPKIKLPGNGTRFRLVLAAIVASPLCHRRSQGAKKRFRRPRSAGWSSCAPIARSAIRWTELGPSPLEIAPPFRTLHQRYPVEKLQESLAEGIVTGHPSMPEFQLDPGQVGDVIAYLKSLEN